MNFTEARRVLGVKNSSTLDDLKASYRRKAMSSHPDRKGGDESLFKDVQQAYELLLQSPAFRKSVPVAGYTIVRLSLIEAFIGGKAEVIIGGNVRVVDYPILDNPYTVIEYVFDDQIYPVTFNVNPYPYEWDTGEFPNFYRKGTITQPLEVSPFTLILGGWIQYIGFDGVESSVYIPPGCKSGSVLTLKGKGYWKEVAENTRGDCLLRIIPMIKTLEEYSSGELNGFKERLANL